MSNLSSSEISNLSEISHLDPIDVSVTTDRSLELFSNSKIDDINTCPTYGIVRHHHRRSYESSSRSLALEYGGAGHEAFAAIRLWQVYTQQARPDLADLRGEQIFTATRWADAVKEALAAGSDQVDQYNALAFFILHSGPYYDDPGDQIRTVSELENVILRAVDEHVLAAPRWPIFLFESGESFESKFVGVEQTFDITVTYSDGFHIRFGGTLDALLYSLRERIPYLGENKVMSRPDTHWERAFHVSHQVTGYIIGTNTILSSLGAITEPITKCKIFGLKNKQTGHQDDYRTFTVTREAHMMVHWFRSLRSTVDEYNRHKGDLETAPRRTQACNRYFRACSLVDFCSDTPQGRAVQLEEMLDRGNSPTEEALGV